MLEYSSVLRAIVGLPVYPTPLVDQGNMPLKNLTSKRMSAFLFTKTPKLALDWFLRISKQNENINYVTQVIYPQQSSRTYPWKIWVTGSLRWPSPENERRKNHLRGTIFKRRKSSTKWFFIGDDDVYMLVFKWSYSKATTFWNPTPITKLKKKNAKRFGYPFSKRLKSSDFCHLRLRQRNFVQTAGAKVQAQPAKRVIAQRCFAREQGIDRGHLEHQGLGFKNLKVHRFALGSLYFQSSDYKSVVSLKVYTYSFWSEIASCKEIPWKKSWAV